MFRTTTPAATALVWATVGVAAVAVSIGARYPGSLQTGLALVLLGVAVLLRGPARSRRLHLLGCTIGVLLCCWALLPAPIVPDVLRSGAGPHLRLIVFALAGAVATVDRYPIASNMLLLAGASATWLALGGHALGFKPYYDASGTTLTLLSTLLLAAQCVGLILTRPDFGFALLLRGSTPVARAARSLLPVPFLVPFALSLISRWIAEHRLTLPTLNFWFFALANTTMIAGLTWATLELLRRSEARRAHAEAELEAANAELEHRVTLRTQALTEANENLRLEIDRREQTQAQLHLAQVAAGLASWTWDYQTNLVYWSDELYLLLGLEPQSMPASYERWLEFIHPEDRPWTTSAARQAIANGQPIASEFRVIRVDGQTRWLLGRARTFQTRSTSQILGFCLDITEQKATELALRRANHDLEQFAYSASHDLKEPLRTVAIYSELLYRNYRGKLDARADTWLDFTIASAQRMSRLIDDLLAFTGTSQAIVEPPQSVDSCEILDAVLQTFAATIEEKEAIVTRGNLPHVEMHRVHMFQILQNLISNALRYQRPDEPPRIHVAATVEKGKCHFTVVDNGIGIAPQYRELVFGLFKRLDHNHSGTGIGLALCKKIVEQYNCGIWAGSSPAGGTAVHFTAPHCGDRISQTPKAAASGDEHGAA